MAFNVRHVSEAYATKVCGKAPKNETMRGLVSVSFEHGWFTAQAAKEPEEQKMARKELLAVIGKALARELEPSEHQNIFQAMREYLEAEETK